MRAQSKPFVVEIKTSRRTDRSKEKSIWGNLDLSAVAQEVADDVPLSAAAASAEPKAAR
ncbi:hypothetical protein [Rhizobium sp. 2MFCol3.1]|uniref:hypothetical protein n=1 Tax=Rhizobium sp. 2MFCol3.1 TaxID=1246459 RepID=UPI000366032F|nr:hypothetical protein [Rhizobium sp. 2MFCol3.1]